MAILLESKSFGYDDLNLIAQPQNGPQSREIIKKSFTLNDVYVSPMSAVIGEKFAIEALKNELSICLHRFGSMEDQFKILHKIYDEFGKDEVQEGWRSTYVSVGLNDYDRVKKLKELGHKEVLIDVANGYLGSVVDFARELQKDFVVMVGNVHTAKGLNLYSPYTKVRVGIGGGKVCETSKVTGYTRGQVTEITECYRDRFSKLQRIVADGGIYSGACAAKAFGLGADAIMMGGYFAQAEEAENIIKGEYKYWGGASHKQQKEQYGEIRRHAEGREMDLDKSKIKPLAQIVSDLRGGLASAVSYSGFHNLEQFKGNGTFEIKHS